MVRAGTAYRRLLDAVVKIDRASLSASIQHGQVFSMGIGIFSFPKSTAFDAELLTATQMASKLYGAPHVPPQLTKFFSEKFSSI